MKYPMVEVVWFDAESSDDWEDLKCDRHIKAIRTVGYLIEDKDEFIAVAMQLDLVNQTCSMVMTIPNYWIESIRGLSCE